MIPKKVRAPRVRNLLAMILSLWTISGTAFAEHNRLTPAELDEGWILLFDGETDFGWRATSKADWKVADGAISVSSGEKGFFLSTSEFGDFQLKVDFKNEPQTNSGVFLRTLAAPTDPASDCYELNIAAPDVSPFFTGSFVKRQAAVKFHEGTDWRTFDVTAEGGKFVVLLDGAKVLEFVDPKPLGRGPIGLQFNSGPVSFRNIKLRPLGQTSLFNGKDLTGWKVLPDKKSVFSVTNEGWLNVKNGNGGLESDAQFADFTLQLQILTNGKGLNSGIFFRSIPGEFWNGYESQIQNGFADGDRTKPVDFGTGGFYRRQPARRVVADDFEWFHKTLIASGNHMAAWVNGYQVSDWTDERPADVNPRKGSRLAAGTLQIQGHDPTTDLSFREIRACEIPAR